MSLRLFSAAALSCLTCAQKACSDEYQKEVIAGKGFNPCDVFALAAAVDDRFITESEKVSLHRCR